VVPCRDRRSGSGRRRRPGRSRPGFKRRPVARLHHAVATHVFILHNNPVAATVLGLLNALLAYLRRDELVALLQRVKG
jgi:hypothetical protein